MTQREHKQEQRKTNYNNQKLYRLYKHQQNRNNQKTKMGRKTNMWTLQLTNKWNLTQENWSMAKKSKTFRGTESLLIAAQNNFIRTNYIKARIN